MKAVVVYGISVLLFDTILSLAILTGLVLLHFNSGGLAAQWAFAVGKWIFLQGFTWILTDAKHLAVLSRLAVLLCLLSPVYESTQKLLRTPPSEPSTDLFADLGRLLLGPAVSLFSCVMWEMGFCSNAEVKTSSKNLHQRHLLLRMVKYFKPDALYIIAAFTFIIVSVICKY